MQQEKNIHLVHPAAPAWVQTPSRGLWVGCVMRPTNWETYPEITRSVGQATDQSGVWVEVDIA